MLQVHEMWVNHKSTLAEQALALFARLYEVEGEVADLQADERLRVRQLKAKPAVDALHAWLLAQRQKEWPQIDLEIEHCFSFRGPTKAEGQSLVGRFCQSLIGHEHLTPSGERIN